MIPYNFQLSPLNIQLSRGAYCIKRIFQVKKRPESEQMLIRFFGLKKGLFLLFRESLGREVNLYFIFAVLYRHEDGRRTL